MGRRKTPEKTMNELMSGSYKHIKAVWESLVASAMKTRKVKCPHCSQGFDVKGMGDPRAAMYVMDRVYGRPKQSLEVEAKQRITTGDDFVALQQGVMAEEMARLQAGTVDGTFELVEGEDAEVPVPVPEV